MKKHLLFVLAIVFVVGLSSTVHGESSGSFLIQKKILGDASYMHGGYGIKERKKLSEMADGYNLKLEFSNSGGHYLGNVSVEITDDRNTDVINVENAGPWFFADLSPGNYDLSVRFRDTTKTRQIYIADDLQTVVFHWKTN